MDSQQASDATLNFDGKVVVITGAGNGLGRSHALLFAKLGAKVLVNDLGGDKAGAGQSQSAADLVVEEIRQQGGTAVASYLSVEQGEQIIEQALDELGGVHVVVNNAGILRDKSFHKMSLEEWQSVVAVHLEGAYRVSRAAWPHLREQAYGRLIFTSSAAGIYGNFGQANYGAAKLGLYGLTRTLAVEGASKNIKANAIAPIAGSRMMEGILPDEWREQLKPELVSPLVAYLAHEQCLETGGLYEVGAGWYGKVRWQRSAGVGLAVDQAIGIDDIASHWQAINDFSDPCYPEDNNEAIGFLLQNLQNKGR